MNNYQENLNKKIEETKKVFGKMFGGTCSYHEEGGWDGKNGHFTIKLEGFKKTIDRNKDIGKFFEEGIKIFISPQDQLTTVVSQINTTMDSRGLSECAVEVKVGNEVELIDREVSRNKLIGERMKDNQQIERVNKNKVIKETYHEPRSKEEEKQIIERNKAQREKQKSQLNNSENKPAKAENSIQSDKNQELLKDKNDGFSLPTKITIGSGIILTPIVLVGIVRKWKNK